MTDIKDIRAMLNARIEVIVGKLLPDGTRSGRSWLARCPWRDDNNAGSFAVYIAGSRAGGWKDFATGETGDVFHLIAGCLTGEPRGKAGLTEALVWARDFLGLQSMSDEQRECFKQQARRDQQRAEADRQREARQSRSKALGWWLSAEKFKGSPGETYLRSRGIDICKLTHMPSALKFHWRLKHIETDTIWPGILAGMCATDGEARGHIVAVHRTFLKPDGTDKAPVKPVRKVWPSADGCVIQLARGETGLPVAKAMKDGLLDTLCLCEGIEDGLSIALARPDWRVWAAYSLPNLAKVKLPPTTADVVVSADNDWGKPEAEAQLKRALQAIARQGAPVRVARSSVGKDFNDRLMGVADG